MGVKLAVGSGDGVERMADGVTEFLGILVSGIEVGESLASVIATEVNYDIRGGNFRGGVSEEGKLHPDKIKI